ncbi:MAG: hypothetical protein ACK559_19245, partial [bacterium]
MQQVEDPRRTDVVAPAHGGSGTEAPDAAVVLAHLVEDAARSLGFSERPALSARHAEHHDASLRVSRQVDLLLHRLEPVATGAQQPRLLHPPRAEAVDLELEPSRRIARRARRHRAVHRAGVADELDGHAGNAGLARLLVTLADDRG